MRPLALTWALTGLASCWLVGCASPDGLLTGATPVTAYALDFAVDPALVEEIAFETEDGLTLAGVWLRQPQAAPPLVLFHSGQNIDAHVLRMEHLWSWGVYDVLAFDYRGHGRSDGAADFSASLVHDGPAAARYAADSVGVEVDEVPWVAFSLGSTAALHAAGVVSPRALAVEGAPLDLQEWLDAASGLELPSAWFAELDFDNASAAAAVSAPSLFIRGAMDPIVSSESAAALIGAAGGPAALWEPEWVGHDDVLQVSPEAYRDRVFAALNSQ